MQNTNNILFSVLSGNFTGIIIADTAVNSDSVLIIKSVLHSHFWKYLLNEYKLIFVQRDSKIPVITE